MICDIVALELIRLAPNHERARGVARRLDAFEAVPMYGSLWPRTRELQLELAGNCDHRRVPPADLLIAAAAEASAVTVIHYDRDYERIAAVSDLRQRWLVPDGTLSSAG
ncbi:hypothetical protein BH20ACT19_BH20ACT19_07280 [soil metagenome]